jgi:general L-amino acid transport system permease protein
MAIGLVVGLILALMRVSHSRTLRVISTVYIEAIRVVVPPLGNYFISLFKDTSLVSIVALFDLLNQLRASFADPVWSTPTTVFTGFAFAGIVYFTFCFGMSRYSLFVEHRLNVHRRS